MTNRNSSFCQPKAGWLEPQTRLEVSESLFTTALRLRFYLNETMLLDPPGVAARVRCLATIPDLYSGSTEAILTTSPLIYQASVHHDRSAGAVASQVILTGKIMILIGEKMMLTGENMILTGEKIIQSGVKMILTGEKMILTGEEIKLINAKIMLTCEKIILTDKKMILIGEIMILRR